MPTSVPSASGGEPVEQKRRAWAVSGHHLVRDESLRHPFRAYLVGGLAKGECLGLRKQVRDQQVVLGAEQVERRRETDQVAGTAVVP